MAVHVSAALPPVTMVFAMVDGGKLFAMRHRKDARAVHLCCASVILSTLRQVGGQGGVGGQWV